MHDEHPTPAESPTAKRLRALERRPEVTRYAAPPKGRNVMFPNWTGWKSIKATLFALVTLNAVFMTANVFSPSTMREAMVGSLFLGALGTIVTTLSGTAMSDPSVVKLARRAGLAVALCFLFAGALACQACTKAQGTAIEVAGIDATICVLNHIGEDPPQIALECALSSATDVTRIIDAHKSAEMRERAGLVDAGAR